MTPNYQFLEHTKIFFKRAIVDHFRAMAGSDVFFTLPVLVR